MRTADAAGLGYVVEGSPAALALATQAEHDAAYDAVLSLPEAEGRFAAARHLASTGTPPSLAARILAGLPPDAAAELAAPTPATAPADPHAARRAELAASAALFNRAKGYAA